MRILKRLRARSRVEDNKPTLGQRSNADFCVWLAVALFLKIAAFLTVAKYNDFRSATCLDEFGGYFCTAYVWRTHLCLAPVVGEKDFVKRDLGALFAHAFEFFDIQNTVVGNDVLLPTRFDDRYLSHKSAYYN